MLLIANQRLHVLRQERGITAVCHQSSSPPPPVSLADKLAKLPSHLGWESQAATQLLQADQPLCEERRESCAIPNEAPETAGAPPPP
ncbi:MAG: hypothetical protein AAF614_32310, partial [Chloroflexota bacterium]